MRSRDDFPLPELPIQYKRRLRDYLLNMQLNLLNTGANSFATYLFSTRPPTTRVHPCRRSRGAMHDIHARSRRDPSNRSAGANTARCSLRCSGRFKRSCIATTAKRSSLWAPQSPGRTRVEVEELIGFFANVLVLRTDAAGDPTFREFLGRAAKVAFDAYAHQDNFFNLGGHSLVAIQLIARLVKRFGRTLSVLFQSPTLE